MRYKCIQLPVCFMIYNMEDQFVVSYGVPRNFINVYMWNTHCNYKSCESNVATGHAVNLRVVVVEVCKKNLKYFCLIQYNPLQLLWHVCCKYWMSKMLLWNQHVQSWNELQLQWNKL